MKILVNSRPYDDLPLMKLKDDFTGINFVFEKNPKKFSVEIEDADAVICLKLSEEDILCAKNLKWIQGITSGLNFMPLDYISQRNILLTNAKGVHKTHMTEYAISMMILSARNLHKFILSRQDRIWSKVQTQDEIFNKNLGIIGLGEIGKEIALKANLLGMNVYGVKNHPEEIPGVKKIFSPDNMDWIFENCDFIINLLPYTEKTDSIISRNLLGRIKTSCTIINMGRGRTVDEKALLDILNENKCKLYISDVFSQEPLPEESPFWNCENIIITPHICGLNVNYSEKLYPVLKKNIFLFSKGKKLINIYSFHENY